MIHDFSKDPHAYVHVLTDEILFPFTMKMKGLFKKKQYFVEFSNTIELINHGIRKYGEKYLGTYDHFYFEKPELTQLISKVSYDELVKVWRWRHETNLERVGDYDNAMFLGKNISKYSILSKKRSHVTSELLTMYKTTTNPDDPDYDPNEKATLQMGPPSEEIGPDGKPYGDFMMRLIYDSILINLHLIYASDNKKSDKKLKPALLEFIERYENFTKLPEFEMEKLNPIIEAIVKN